MEVFTIIFFKKIIHGIMYFAEGFNILNKLAKIILYVMLASILFVNVFGLQEVFSGVPRITVTDKDKYQFLLDSEVLKLTLIIALLEATDNFLSILLSKR